MDLLHRGSGSVEIGLRLSEQRRILGELRLRLGERGLIGSRVDLGEEVALLDQSAPPESRPPSARPAIWVLMVTVASGVTAPSASIVIGMSPVVAGASRTVCGGGAGRVLGLARRAPARRRGQ